MRDKKTRVRRWFTIAEFLVASTLLVIILASLLPMAIFTLTGYMKARAISDLNHEATMAQEKIKKDLASTSRAEMVTWPSGGTNLVVVSFPVLRRDITETSLPVDGDGNIAWTDTVIYHIWTDPETHEDQLRRTIFSPRDNNRTAMERLYQTVYTWYYGHGDHGVYPEGTATTEVIVEDMDYYRMTSDPAVIDAYAPVRAREVARLGTWILDPGTHYVKFRVGGRNSNSSGYKIGIDQINLNATGEAADAEYFLPPYVYSGVTPVQESMVGETGWSNNSQLKFNATWPGQYFTLKVHNDMWLESTFNTDLATLTNAAVVYDWDIAENVCEMAGNTETWHASVQSYGGTPEEDPTHFHEDSIRVIIKGGMDPVEGGAIAYAGARGSVKLASSGGKLHIVSAYIMERASGFDGVAGTVRQLTFKDVAAAGAAAVSEDFTSVTIPANDVVASDLFDLPISPAKDYLVSFYSVPVLGHETARSWQNTKGYTDTYIIRNGLANVSGQADWTALGDTVEIEPVARVVAVQSLYVNYPDQGVYTSRILDTQLPDPRYIAANWREQTDAKTDITLRVRSGDQPDLSDAPAWASALAFTNPNGLNSLASIAGGRYLQWQAELHSADPYLTTPKLRDVFITWPGVRRGVDIAVALEMGPDMGIINLQVDNLNPSPASLRMTFRISSDMFKTPYTKTFAVEATPRNR